jgi:hypothetical protein
VTTDTPQLVTLTVSIALAAVDRMDGEPFHAYQDRIADRAAKYLREDLAADHRITIVSIR